MRLLRHTYLLGVEEAREALFRRRAFLSLLVHLGLVVILFIAAQKAEQQVSEVLGGQIGVAEELKRAVQRMGAYATPEVRKLVDEISTVPLSLLLVQLLSFLWFPTLISFVSCDMVAIDNYRGTLRYILMRVSRVAYYLSKCFAHTLLFSVIHAASLLLLVVYVGLTVENLPITTYLFQALKYALVFIAPVFFMVCATALFSSFCRKPLTALMLIQFFWLVVVLLFIQWPNYVPLNPRLTPGLFAPSLDYMLRAFWGYILWGLGFLAAGLMLFSRREV